MIYKLAKRFVLRVYDKTISVFYPYVWRNITLEYVPQHVMLTGGIVPSEKKDKYFRNLAQTIATGYDHGINEFTLHLPYMLWSYTDVSQISTWINIVFKKLDYRPFISFVTNEAD